MVQKCVIWVGVSSDKQTDNVSLDEQLRACRQFADDESMDVVRVFWWDGESRWESDPIQALEDFAAQGRYEYHELREMWRARAFDVLICHNHSRLGRSFTMQSWVIENVIRHGARIYRILGKWIDSSDYVGQVALGGFASVSEVTRFVELRKAGIERRLQRGLPQSRLIFSHRKVVDPDTGKAVRLEVDESLRGLWNDVEAVLLSGVSALRIERALAERGHVAANGKPYPPGSIYRILHNPTFWGHQFWNKGGKYRRYHGGWAYDDEVEPPPDVRLYRNKFLPVYTGEQAERVKNELRRRADIRGRRAPDSDYPLSGLFVCAECGRALSMYLSRGKKPHYIYRAMRCSYANNFDGCTARSVVSERKLIRFVDERLRAWLEAGALVDAHEALRDTSDDTIALEQLRAARDRVENQINTLILEQSEADTDVREMYRQQIRTLKTRMDALDSDIQRASHQLKQTERQQRNTETFLRRLNIEAMETFWQREPFEINQFLAGLMGNTVFVADMRLGKVVGYAERQRRRTPRRRAKS